MGKDVEKATQRAAEAALMQVVGSFIDSDTRIEKRKEIRDGIRTRVKSVRSKISEYSQGSIQRLDILDVERDGGFIRVTAKVAVRIEDFKRYIKKVVLTKKKIKKGLLAKFRVAKKQSRNLSDLVNQKLLRPILEYRVLIPEIASEVKSLRDLYDSRPEAYGRLTRVLKPGSNDLVIYFYLDVKLNPDFVANARRVLKETAKNEYSIEKYYAHDIYHPGKVRNISWIGIGSYFGTPLTLLSRQSQTCKKLLWDDTGVGIHCAYHERPVFYTYPAVPSGVLCKGIKKLKAEFRQPEPWYSDKRKGWLTPNLRMRFVAENGKVLREEVLEYESGVTRSAYSYIVMRGNSIPKDSRLVRTGSSRAARAASSQSVLLTRGRGVGSEFCSVFIQTSTTFTIISKVSEAILAKAEGIDLQYVR